MGNANNGISRQWKKNKLFILIKVQLEYIFIRISDFYFFSQPWQSSPWQSHLPQPHPHLFSFDTSRLTVKNTATAIMIYTIMSCIGFYFFDIIFPSLWAGLKPATTLGISVLIIIIADRHKPCPYIIRSNLQSDRMQTTRSMPPMWCSLPQRPPT